MRLLCKDSLARLRNIGFGHLFPESFDGLEPRLPISGHLLTYCVVYCLTEDGGKPVGQQAQLPDEVRKSLGRYDLELADRGEVDHPSCPLNSDLEILILMDIIRKRSDCSKGMGLDYDIDKLELCAECAEFVRYPRIVPYDPDVVVPNVLLLVDTLWVSVRSGHHSGSME